MIESNDIYKLFKVKTKNIELYKMSIVHKSAMENLCTNSYERLEFVGDSIINMITAKYLYLKFPNENEGFLTRARTKIVSTQGLSTIANKLGISQYIEMNQSGKDNKWNENSKIQEDVLEALIGAIFLDKGYNTAEKVFLKIIETHVDWEHIHVNDNYKDLLCSFAHSKGFKKVEYNIVKKENNDYIVQVIIDGIKTCEGTSKQKKAAEQIAAKRALKTLQIV
jgi:ribonuclease-3